MNFTLFKIQLERTTRTPFLISYLLTAVTSFVALAFYLTLPPVIPLFYTLAEPTAQLANKEWIFLFPFLAISIGALHTFYLVFFSKNEAIAARLFAWSTVVMQALLIISLLRILFLVL